jgi:hypothetical protein
VAWSDLANRQVRPSTAHTHTRARVESAAAARSAAVLFAAAAREPLVTRIMISRNGSRTRQKNVVVGDPECRRQGLRGCQDPHQHQHQQHWTAMVTHICVLAAVLQTASAGQSAQDIMDRYGQYIDQLFSRWLRVVQHLLSPSTRDVPTLGLATNTHTTRRALLC